jgi:hypothetical protein
MRCSDAAVSVGRFDPCEPQKIQRNTPGIHVGKVSRLPRTVVTMILSFRNKRNMQNNTFLPIPGTFLQEF